MKELKVDKDENGKTVYTVVDVKITAHHTITLREQDKEGFYLTDSNGNSLYIWNLQVIALYERIAPTPNLNIQSD